MTEPAATVGWLPRAADELFGEGATAEDAYDLLTADVPADAWIAALTVARDELGCAFFDWLSAVDEPGTGFHVCAHVAALPTPGSGQPPRRLLLRTTVPHEAPTLPTATGVYAGAAWHERETHEMFGVDFPGHPQLAPLLLPDTFEGHPLRKDFVLAARVAKAWPGAKEPGESGHGGPKRRQMLPPGVPDPNEWGPLKGQLPPAPARPARSRAAATDRPRRARSASAGSASQRTPEPDSAGKPEAAPKPEVTPKPEATPKLEVTPEPAGSGKPEAAPNPEPTETETGTPASGEPRAKREPKAPGDAPWHQPAPGEGDREREDQSEGDRKGEDQREGKDQSEGDRKDKDQREGEDQREGKDQDQDQNKGKDQDRRQDKGEREGEREGGED